jgi:protein gp37
MNRQLGTNRIEWTEIFGPGSGFTANPIGGCHHGCRWTMPDGSVATCYAETTALKFTAAYSEGFAAHYWRPAVLAQIRARKEPAGIFIDSMADLWGHWVPDEQRDEVLATIAACPQHVFFSLTKNAPGMLKRCGRLPRNLWPGISSPPDVMHGKPLTRQQQAAMLAKGLAVLQTLRTAQPELVTWLSAEPLSWDVAPLLADRHLPSPAGGFAYDVPATCAVRWIVIGAASHGRRYFPPEEGHARGLVEWAEAHGVKVHFKGNMKCLPWAAANWREGWPEGPE